MDSFNKVISFVLGLVVVIVFFLVLTGKINFINKLNRPLYYLFPVIGDMRGHGRQPI